MEKSVLGYGKNLGKITNGENKEMNVIMLDSGQLYNVKDENLKNKKDVSECGKNKGLLSYYLNIEGSSGEFVFE